MNNIIFQRNDKRKGFYLNDVDLIAKELPRGRKVLNHGYIDEVIHVDGMELAHDPNHGTRTEHIFTWYDLEIKIQIMLKDYLALGNNFNLTTVVHFSHKVDKLQFMPLYGKLVRFFQSLEKGEIYGFDMDTKEFFRMNKNEQRMWKMKVIAGETE